MNAQATPVEHSPDATRSGGFLAKLERLGNKLPAPLWLFMFFAVMVAVGSWIGSALGLHAQDPQTGETIYVTNLLTKQGIQQMFSEAINNFTTFPPLGVIITVMFGVAVAEHSGLISALIRVMVARVGARTITFMLSLAGVTGSIASDAIYVILIPIGAISFRALGRSPIVGAIVAFAASSAGFNASLILNITDVLLGGISTSAAHIVDESYEVSPLANYFFVIASTILLSLIITAVTELYMERKAHSIIDHSAIDFSELSFANSEDSAAPSDSDTSTGTGADSGAVSEKDLSLKPQEVKALKVTGIAAAIYIACYFAALFAPFSPLYSPEGPLEGPLIRAIAVPITAGFFILGTVYGLAAKTITESADVPNFIAKGLAPLLPLIGLFLVLSQFLAWFKWSNLGVWLAIKGAELLQKWHLPLVVTFTLLVLMVALLNLLITSGSAQWSLMAPIVVPMMMYIGVSPEVSQMIFRIGDSTTNIITPMSPSFALALIFLQRYYKKAGVGTLFSLALPYSLSMLISWFLFFILWYFLGLPLGPGTPYTYPA
ncbi:AbgT family transporter [Corynebacterium sp. sy017]|uniref:AbgT family transporter n=1 Tax=unclassified Corynebacterium TaxID=2624378 RepID=UPI001186C64F|nr:MULTISPECIES: AbgT family transporter [unclassified Corynebacterium]MBP3088771.1 AbgT family transporter [Corynebacterium sp. sy017]QDZ42163.1 AbgT family transporter [Corynebacterium sp. sy039]TSD92052.1 AbgT family transporter [Corynebacterium sp. SY003]